MSKILPSAVLRVRVLGQVFCVLVVVVTAEQRLVFQIGIIFSKKLHFSISLFLHDIKVSNNLLRVEQVFQEPY